MAPKLSFYLVRNNFEIFIEFLVPFTILFIKQHKHCVTDKSTKSPQYV